MSEKATPLYTLKGLHKRLELYSDWFCVERSDLLGQLFPWFLGRTTVISLADVDGVTMHAARMDVEQILCMVITLTSGREIRITFYADQYTIADKIMMKLLEARYQRTSTLQPA